jgi:hypothetical protein
MTHPYPSPGVAKIIGLHAAWLEVLMMSAVPV